MTSEEKSKLLTHQGVLFDDMDREKVKLMDEIAWLKIAIKESRDNLASMNVSLRTLVFEMSNSVRKTGNRKNLSEY